MNNNEQKKFSREDMLRTVTTQYQVLIDTILVFRTPDNAFEINEAIKEARSSLHWFADATQNFKIENNNTKVAKRK